MSGAPSQLIHKEVVRAGAGAGKTTNLTRKVVETARAHYAQHGQWPRMVVTTFTRKATQELRERLITLACRENDPALLDFFCSRSSLQISTLHGVFSLFLRRYGHLLGIDPGFSILSEQEAHRLSRRVLRDVLFSNPEYQPLLDHLEFRRINELVMEFGRLSVERPDIQPVQIEDLQSLWINELKNWAQRLQKISQDILSESTQSQWLDYAQGLNTLTEGWLKIKNVISSEQLVEQLKNLGSKPRFSSKNPPVSQELDDELADALERFKKEWLRPEYNSHHWPQLTNCFACFYRLATAWNERFRQHKLASGRLQMADLELMALHSLRAEPRVAQVFAAEWDYWLIDEYQDTSPLQVEILKHLVGDKGCYVVGDPQQSIYLFRGARSEVFAQLEQDVEASGGRLSQLMTNYRSTPELLAFFNEFFTRHSPHFRPMEPREAREPNSKEVVALFARANQKKDGEGLEHSEECAILQRIRRLINEGHRYEDICVLARTRRDLLEVARFLKDHGVPTHVHSSSGFYSRREVADALSVLKFLLNPHDNLNMIQLLRSPWFRVEDGFIAHQMQKRPKSLWTHLLSQCADQPMVQQLQQLQALVDRVGLIEAFERALVESGLFDLSHYHDSTGRREANLWKLLDSLREQSRKPGFSITSFIQNNAQAELSENEVSEDTEAVAALEPNRVNLMTIHASKGLKFNHILLVKAGKRPRLSSHSPQNHLLSCNERGQFSLALPLGEELKLTGTPLDRAHLLAMDQRELAEFDRVLYVALTRAAQSVFISWSEPVHQESWIGRTRIDLSEGDHQHSHFTYRVECGPWPLSSDLDDEKAKSSSVRAAFAKWESTDSAPLRGTFSVTRLLEEIEGLPMSSGRPASFDVMQLKRRLDVSNDGILIHRLMELLKYRSNLELDELVEKWFVRRKSEVLKAVEFVRKQSQPPMMNLITEGHVEWGFQVATKQGILEGQIDLWATLPDGVTWVVDYKSGSPEYSERAFSQLALYSYALRLFRCQGPLMMAVIYPLAEKCIVRPAPSRQEVAERFRL